MSQRRRQSKQSEPEFQGVDEIVQLLEELPRVQVGETYTQDDRAADFYATFTTDAGRRVLSQILQICDMPALPRDADLPGTLAFKSGKRRVFNEIQRCFVVRGGPIMEGDDAESSD